MTTIAQRAKAWHGNTFFVEWMDNTVAACTTDPGKQLFEAWSAPPLPTRYYPGMRNSASRKASIVSPYGLKPQTTTDKDSFLWQSAGKYYGITSNAAQYFHEFAAGHEPVLYHPVQTKPPLRREEGRNVGAMAYAITTATNSPSLTLNARRTALSEYDKIRDRLERWRTDPDFFFADIIERSACETLNPATLAAAKTEEQRQEYLLEAALCESISFYSLLHSAWKDAALLLEELASKGLTTPAMVERAYQKDHTLLWRIVSVTNRAYTIQRRMTTHMQAVFAASDFYKPYFRAYRDQSGKRHIVENTAFCDALNDQGKWTGLDNTVSHFVTDQAASAFSLIANVDLFLRESPEEVAKLSEEVFAGLGDLAAITEFSREFTATEFGTAVAKYANEVQARGPSEVKQMRAIVYYMDPMKLARRKPEGWDRAGEASRSIRELDDAWRECIARLNTTRAKVWPLAQTYKQMQQSAQSEKPAKERRKEKKQHTHEFNMMWLVLDYGLWKGGAALERDGEAGRVAAEYGVYNPMDPTRPKATVQLLRTLDSQPNPDVEPKPTQTTTTSVPLAYVQNIPVARPDESIRPQRETAEPKGALESSDSDEEEDEDQEPVLLPQYLPQTFKLGKKALKVFHRILEPPEEERENAPAKGQVRWGDFENAMKRIGFEIEQTAGSSVRFDPPASSARPISFHRPHPDAILNPHSIKCDSMLIDGHRLPVIDLDLVRRMAISEYDKSRDTLERWRSDPQFFFGDLLERSKSIILSPEIVNRDAMYKQRHSIDDAFRTLVNFRSMVHGAWRDAASLCEYLAAQELHTPAAIERAYKRDTALLWRFVSVINRIGTMHRKMWANLQQLLAGSEYYRPLLKPWRDKRGLAHIDINEREVKKLVSARTFTGMDEVVVRSASDVSPSATTFFQAVEVSLAEDRSQDLKFSSAVYDAMGDFAAVTEFESQFTRTEFGDNLVKYAAELEKSGTDILQMRSVLYFMDPSKLAREDAQYWDRMGEASRSIRAMDDAWSMKTWELTMDTVVASIQHLAGPGGLTTVDKFDIFPAEAFNEMWRRIDAQLWSIAASLDRRGDGGRVAAEYGVWSPKDAKRPVASMYFFKELESEVRQDTKVALQPQPTAEYVSNIPIAREGETGAQSARAYVATNAPTTKEKVKTRGDVSAAVTDAAKGDEPKTETPPQAQFFPSQFKLGKKVMKLFHRILEPPEEEKENAPAKGEVRWGDFEKARPFIIRIGFEVVQTAGSSVRFDPPATTARPITFHRPHPDSLLSPQAIKWFGLRSEPGLNGLTDGPPQHL
ncbi:hypothetical protein MKEN_01488000 [Mycena kentingensis (nom. inval.)]|nr:hypothetical protein MKEN_01488000 [Mycena kentingensis (nom. inval.)]